MTQVYSHLKKYSILSLVLTLTVISCMKYGRKSKLITVRESPTQGLLHAKEITAKTAIKLAPGLQIGLWASDSLAPDPIALTVDDEGRVYITRTNRQKNSEFDIRGHQDWMTPSIGLQTVEERRAFLHKTFAPERSKENDWLKDLNFDGVHDWHDLAVEQDEIWRIEDTNKDGIADLSTRILSDFNEEITDVAGGILVRDKDVFLSIAPDLWRLEDTNNDGILDKKTSISHGYAVHIGFSGHGMSGIVEGPDGRIYWNIGDIGANITTASGKKFENPNSGLIARCNPDGSDFEIFATGLRNTHEFAFDQYGNLISVDNDGDHQGESERLVHVVEGSDAGWRSNWQYGKYTDPLNNGYNVWMDERLFVPRWEGQAAYIIPPIVNYHNGPTGMVYNPGTALGSAWKNKFFMVEFVGSTVNSHIWSFGLKPKGASFELDGETDVLSGILPTGIQFGPDGALYVADWINGWGTKNYGRVWKLDVTPETNDLKSVRLETKQLIQINYGKQSNEMLGALLYNPDMRIRQKAQFELVKRGTKGQPTLLSAANQSTDQLARIHGIWGLGQLARQNAAYASLLTPFLKDADPEVIAQTAKMIGDAGINATGDVLMTLLTNPNYRVRFYAAEALGQLGHKAAVQPLIRMLEANNDQDLYIRHAGVLALARIGSVEPIVALANNPKKALRTAAVLVLRHLSNPEVALFLTDKEEYIATEAARAINDDLSIPAALPALAAVLKEKRFTSVPLLRRAINAALRVGGEKELDLLIAFSIRTDISEELQAEALAALGTWAAPSLTDRVDGRYRGTIERNPSMVRVKVEPHVPQLLQRNNPATTIALAGMLSNLNIASASAQLAQIFAATKDNNIKTAILPALNRLQYNGLQDVIKSGLEDSDERVRAVALGLLNDSNVTKESLPALVSTIFSKGSIREKQQLLVVLGKLDPSKTRTVLEQFVADARAGKWSSDLNLELKEAVQGSGSADLQAQLAAIRPQTSPLDAYADALYGGDIESGRGIFFWNSAAQCTRCHAMQGEGGKVGPDLTDIGKSLTREQLLQALVDPSARLAPGYGTVSLQIKDGQEVFGVLVKETDSALTIKTSDAEPLVVATSRITKKTYYPSSMPNMGETLSKREIRDLVAFLAKS